MHVTAFLADSVVAPGDGKLYAIGAGWNVIWTQTFPTRHPRIGLGIIITVPYTATNHMHTLEAHLEDADGNVVKLGDGPDGSPVTNLGGEFNVGRPPLLPPGDDQLVAIAMQMDGVEFDHPDRYRIVISIDGTEMASLPLRVAPVPQQPGPLPGVR